MTINEFVLSKYPHKYDDFCKNCYWDYGVHHYETLQCPVVPDSEKYKNTRFESKQYPTRRYELEKGLSYGIKFLEWIRKNDFLLLITTWSSPKHQRDFTELELFEMFLEETDKEEKAIEEQRKVELKENLDFLDNIGREEEE